MQVSTIAGAPEAAHRADHRELVVAGLAAGRAGRIDQAVASAVGEPDREDRLAAGTDLGDPRAFLEGDLRPRLAGDVEKRSEGHEGQERHDQAEQDDDREPADDDAPIGRHEDRGDRQDLRPDLVEDIDDVHGRILSVTARSSEPCAGCPSWSSRRGPGFHDGRSVSAGSPSCWLAAVTGFGPRAGRGLPTDGEASRPVPSRPRSQADPAVRAPRSRAPWRRSRSSVTTRRAADPSAPSSIRTSSMMVRMTASAVRPPL